MTRRYTPEQKAARLAYTKAWRIRNAERVREYESRPSVKARRKANQRRRRRVNAAKERSRQLRYRMANRGRLRAYTRAWTQANKERKRASNAAWWKANPGMAQVYAKRRQVTLAWRKVAASCAANR
jgi:hypothetical protein